MRLPCVSWFVAYGTAIGAVRHDGFIPWADDIDVGMLRPDYERFMREAENLFPTELSIQSIRHDPDYNLLHAKIRHSGTTFLEAGWETRKGNQGIFIDVFPIDYIPDTPLAKWFFMQKIRYYQILITILTEKETGIHSRKKKGIKGVLFSIAKIVTPLLCSSAKSAATKLDTLLSKSKPTNTVQDCEVRRIEYQAKWFSNTAGHKFEDIDIKLPIGYDEYLTTIYGDYMTPPPAGERTPIHLQGIVDCQRPYTYYLKKD